MRIHFLKNTADFYINEKKKNILIIYHEKYINNLPIIKNVKKIEFQNYKKNYQKYSPDIIIIVGLNRIITPSNRCDFINEYLQTMTPHIKKYSIDTCPFIGEPWRLWFHYSITNSGKFNITYSYAIETEWKHWFYRERNDCRLAANNISLFINNTYSDLDILRTTFSFMEYIDFNHNYYKEALHFCLQKYNSPKLIINNLLKLCNKHYNININYDSYLTNKKYKIPNLGIYKFIVEENIRRMNIYNKVILNENL